MEWEDRKGLGVALVNVADVPSDGGGFWWVVAVMASW